MRLSTSRFPGAFYSRATLPVQDHWISCNGCCTNSGPMVRIMPDPDYVLRDDFETTLLHEVEQFQRGSGGALLTDFPLLHGRDTGIQQRRKYRLADM